MGRFWTITESEGGTAFPEHVHKRIWTYRSYAMPVSHNNLLQTNNNDASVKNIIDTRFPHLKD